MAIVTQMKKEKIIGYIWIQKEREPKLSLFSCLEISPRSHR